MADTKKTKKVTPLMQQYNTIKVKYPDALLLFRVGDFYETFGEDAVKASQILGIILTHRNNGGDRTELAGFPHHSLNTYLPKLVKAGQRVAICDQLEDPKLAKTIVKRGVTELVTPGVAMNDDILTAKSNNFLCAVHFGRKHLGIAFVDISTGEFLTAEGSEEQIDKLLQNFSPTEILISKANRKEFLNVFGTQFHTFFMEDWVFQDDYAQESLTQHFKTKTLKGFGVDHLSHGVVAAGVVLHYLSDTQHKQLQHINTLQRIAEEEYIWMDRFTIRNLELYHSNNQNAVTLLDVIDRTLSPMGGRMLKRWLALPLKNIEKIRRRHQVIGHLSENEGILQKLRNAIKLIGDLERLISKVATGRISPKEVVQLKNSLEAIVPIKQTTTNSKNEALGLIGDQLHDCEMLRNKIKEILNEEAPVHIGKGITIAKGYSQELDELRELAFSGKDYLNKMLERETVRTGISSLKIDSNNVFGYYIEVRNTHKDKVPEDWIRKQTLVNAERYITEELKEYESKILGAEERILGLEQQLFSQLVIWMQEYIAPVQNNAYQVAKLDCLCGFTQLALENKYVAPIMDDSTEISIIGGRHPVIEKQLPLGEAYIANDVHLDREQQQIIMITG
ncbi:MAG TPA: DNA mismatch repair protein MutS, partial [Arenibacter sp.]|nr:DNA mismatch repair protein MutS [Arenibacter sp.]